MSSVRIILNLIKMPIFLNNIHLPANIISYLPLSPEQIAADFLHQITIRSSLNQLLLEDMKENVEYYNHHNPGYVRSIMRNGYFSEESKKKLINCKQLIEMNVYYYNLRINQILKFFKKIREIGKYQLYDVENNFKKYAKITFFDTGECELIVA